MSASNKVLKTNLPDKSRLTQFIKPGDFVDCYSVESVLSARAAAQITTEFPAWAKFLLKVRSIIVAPFGLSTEGPSAVDKMGIFPVETESDDEVIVGFDDKHLDFRVSTIAHEGRIYLATWVHTNNIGGQIYLKAIMPFHILVVRNAVARVRSAGALD